MGQLHKQNTLGFTLVEIITIVVILGIMVAIALPVFINLKTQANARSEQQTAESVRSGIRGYYLQSMIASRNPPYPATLDAATDGIVSNTNQFFTNVLSVGPTLGWSKSGFSYNGPTGSTYAYDPSTGVFDTGRLIYGWNMNEGSGNTTGQGVFQGHIVGDAQWTTGKVGDALHFDGLGSHVNIPTSADLDLTTAGTLESWIYVDSVPYSAGIIHKGDLADFSDEAYSLQFWSNNRVALIVNRAGGYNYSIIEAATSIQSSQWCHVAATWDAAGMRIYINGALNASNTIAAVAQKSSGSLNIGAQTTQNYSPTYYNLPFHGIIDEAMVYNRALTAEEIKAYYDATK